jgi:hypothetical protein
MTLRVTVKTHPGQQVGVRRALSEAITTAFHEAGIPPPLVTLPVVAQAG